MAEESRWTSSASPDPQKRKRAPRRAPRPEGETSIEKIWSKHVKRAITREKKEPVKNPKTKEILFYRWVRVPLIERWVFENWTNPTAAGYNPKIVEAIKHGEETDDWTWLVKLCKEQRKALAHEEGLDPRPSQENNSSHELVVTDIFKICGISYKYQVPVIDPNNPNDHQPMIADYQLGDGRLLEIFGMRWDDYQKKAAHKANIWKDKLWYLNFIHVSVEKTNVQLLGYARCMDERCCHQERCDLPLFAGEKVEDMLKEKVPLLLGRNFSLTRNYIIQLFDMGKTGRDEARQRIDEHYLDQSTGEITSRTPRAPKYRPPRAADMTSPEWRDPEGNLIPMIKQIRRHSPTALGKEDRSQPMPLPMRATAQLKMPQPQLEALDIPQMEEALHGEYDSVHTWSDEEKVAMYFKTPEALMQAMQNMASAQPQPMQRAASNWYQAMRINR